MTALVLHREGIAKDALPLPRVMAPAAPVTVGKLQEPKRLHESEAAGALAIGRM